MKLELEKYGPIISDKTIGAQIYSIIHEKIGNHEFIEIDFTSIISMATFCAKQIFGTLYIELGPETFFRKIKLSNVSEDLQIIIKMGIQSAIEEEGALD